MDLRLHLQVLSRHRVLLGAGAAAAILLALVSYVRIGTDGVQYRKQEQWQSVTRLFVAQPGFPFRPGGSNVDPTTIAVIASQFVNSDAVIQMLRRDKTISSDGKINGKILAGPLTDNNNQFLPFIEVSGIGPSPSAAQTLAQRAGAAIATYVQRQEAGVPKSRRISLQVVSQPSDPTLLSGRSKSTTMFLFLGVMSVTVIAAYVLENFRRAPAGKSAELVPLTESGDSSTSEAISPVAASATAEPSSPPRRPQEARRPSTLTLRPPSRGDANDARAAEVPRENAEGSRSS